MSLTTPILEEYVMLGQALTRPSEFSKFDNEQLPSPLENMMGPKI